MSSPSHSLPSKLNTNTSDSSLFKSVQHVFQSEQASPNNSSNPKGSSSSLSMLILSEEEYWMYKVKSHDCSSLENLLLDSDYISQQQSQLLNCEEENMDNQRASISSEDQSLLLESKIDPQQFAHFKRKRPSQIIKLSRSSEISYSLSESIKQSLFSFTRDKSKFLTTQINQEMQKIKKMKDLQEIAMLGYWCSIFFPSQNIRWQITCMLLYKEIVKEISDLIKTNKKMVNNLEKIICRIVEKYDIPKEVEQKLKIIEESGEKDVRSKEIFHLILTQSQIMVGDIMKSQLSMGNKFCLFKTVRALNLYGALYGINPIQQEESLKQQEFSIQNLKKNLLAYKKLVCC